MATVKVVLRKDKVNQNTGLAPLYLRIIKDRKSKFISLGVKVEPKYWNEEKSVIRKGAVNYQELNNFILQKRAEAERTALDIEGTTKSATTKRIKDEIIGKKPSNFFEYAERKLSELKHTIAPSTHTTYGFYIGKIEKFLGHKNITFQEMDIDFIKRYEKYLYEEVGNKPSTVEYSFRVIKVMFNYAISEGIVDYNTYVFRQYKFKKPKAVKNYLNEEQFQALLKYEPPKQFLYDVYYDMFVFSCYAGGLRHFDTLELKWSNYNEQEERITKVIRKTKRKHQIKLPQKAVEIIKKYKTKKSKKSDFIFPVLSNDIDYDVSKELIYNVKNTINGKTNHFLRQMGRDLELPFTLSFHTSRHTFATRALNKGMRIEHVSKVLDHTDISITQVYAKIVNKELDKAMEIMDD
ncbi:MAG: recombinase [Marinilabiliales bacterium]|nr:MAG: recombinase [Marinilabiliales bacterium]